MIEQLEYGNNMPCPVCKSPVAEYEHYLLITEYVKGNKKGKFRIHFNCWKDQYNKATSQWFELMGKVGQDLFIKMYELVQNGQINEENIKEILQEVNKNKEKMFNLKPEDYLNSKDKVKGDKKQHGNG